MRRALGWFEEVESRCSRFDASSELSELCRRPGERVAVSPLLFHVLEIAVAVAQASGGAFDPTVGAALRRAGFDRNYRDGAAAPQFVGSAGGTFRDIGLNVDSRTVTLARPVALDLGGVAKGFAIDLAVRELAPFQDFAINAGGDLFLRGMNGAGQPWRIGIRDPQAPDSILGAVEATNVAVCTSGGYERRDRLGHGHHLLNPSTGRSPSQTVSVTAIGPTAALADAASTAAFVLGGKRGLRFLQGSGLEGLIVSRDGARLTTPGFPELMS